MFSSYYLYKILGMPLEQALGVSCSGDENFLY